MCGNRVEELEEKVNQLQATVDGLTDELVECKVRVRELENAVDEDNGFDPDDNVVGESDDPAEEAKTEEPDATDDEESTDSESDIIVA